MPEKVDRRIVVKGIAAGIAALFLSPLTTLAGFTQAEVKRLRCPIYYWHEVNKDAFRVSIENLLAENFFPVALRDIADYFDNDIRIWPEGRNPAVLTFDDARLSQFENALPILDQYRLRATFFVLQNYADGSNKYMSDVQIKELSDGGWEVGSHGFRHRPLPLLRVQNPEAWKDDIIASKIRLEDITGRDVSSFAYPYGRSGGVDQETKLLVATTYRIAVTTGGNVPDLRSDGLFELPRLWRS